MDEAPPSTPATAEFNVTSPAGNEAANIPPSRSTFFQLFSATTCFYGRTNFMADERMNRIRPFPH